MHEQLLQRHLPQIIDDLAARGWSRLDNVLPATLTHELAEECRKRVRAGALNPAGVGRGQGLAVREGIRGDSIQWLAGWLTSRQGDRRKGDSSLERQVGREMFRQEVGVGETLAPPSLSFDDRHVFCGFKEKRYQESMTEGGARHRDRVRMYSPFRCKSGLSMEVSKRQ